MGSSTILLKRRAGKIPGGLLYLRRHKKDFSLITSAKSAGRYYANLVAILKECGGNPTVASPLIAGMFLGEGNCPHCAYLKECDKRFDAFCDLIK